MFSVLVVEDTKNKYAKIESLLNSLQVEKNQIDWAKDIAAAENFLKKDEYGLLILDMVLPESSENHELDQEGGLSVLDTLVEDEELYHPKNIIVLTEFSDLIEEYNDNLNSSPVITCKYETDSNDWKEVIRQSIVRINRQVRQVTNRRFDNDVVVTLHGIRTSGKWQDLLGKKLGDAYSYEPYKFNFFPLFGFLNEKKVLAEIKCLKIFISKLHIQYPKAKFNFVAHSFGTYIVHRALLECEECFDIGSIILSGSVLKTNVNLDSLYKKHKIDNIVNDCVTLDFPIILATIANSRYSNAGIRGIKGGGRVVQNRYIKGGHSSCFSDTHLNDWCNIIINKKVIKIDERNLSFFYDIYYPVISSRIGILLLFSSVVSIFSLIL